LADALPAHHTSTSGVMIQGNTPAQRLAALLA
jgi:hypothetical protein